MIWVMRVAAAAPAIPQIGIRRKLNATLPTAEASTNQTKLFCASKAKMALPISVEG